jgi:hypothetical protein
MPAIPGSKPKDRGISVRIAWKRGEKAPRFKKIFYVNITKAQQASTEM